MRAYPPWFSVLDCARAEQAFTDAEATRVPQPLLVHAARAWVQQTKPRFASAAKAQDAALTVIAALVSVIERASAPLSLQERRAALLQLRDQVLVWAHAQQPGPTVLPLQLQQPPSPPLDREAFVAQVNEAIERAPWWSAFWATRATSDSGPATAPVDPLDDDDALFTLEETATKLQVHKRTVERMIARGELHAVAIRPKLVKVPASEIRRIRVTPKQQFVSASLHDLA